MATVAQSHILGSTDLCNTSFAVAPQAISDGDLFKQYIKTRDDLILRSLMKKYERPLMAYLLRLTQNYHDAEAALNATWDKVVLSGDTFDSNRSFTPFIYKIATNICIDLYRKESLRHKKNISISHGRRIGCSDNEISLDRALYSNDLPPPVIFDKNEASELLKMRINSLSSPYKEYITRHFLEGLPLAEVDPARPLGTIKSRMHTGLMRLKELYKDD